MAVNANWPLTVTQFSSADPFDAGATPSWQDISTRVRELTAATGKQYELDQQQTGEASVVVSDKDEALNPTNPQSTYYPNVKPYRQLIDQAMWPPAPLGSAVNLLVGQISPAIDPTSESYTNGASPSWALTVGAGVTLTVTTTNPQQGTKCLTYAVTSGGGENGVGFTVATIPGQQYTASIYVRQTAANTTQIFVNGGAAGTSTTTINAYVRLTVTFTATATTHQVWVASFTTGSSGTVNIDALQVETGASASTFSSAAGPVIYGNWAGYVERWPSRWNHRGMYGMAEITCVDGLGILAGQFLSTEARNAVMAKSPTLYYPLSEPSGAATAAEVSGNGGPALTRLDSSFGPAPTFALGTAANLPGDPSGTGLAVDTGNISANVAASVLQAGTRQVDAPLGFVLGATPYHYSVGLWVQRGTTGPAGAETFGFNLLGTDVVGTWTVAELWIDQSANQLHATASTPPSNTASVVITDQWADSKPHLYVMVVDVVPPNVTCTLYVDGVVAGTNANALAGTNATSFVANTMQVGGLIPRNTLAGGAAWNNAVYEHVALWSRALSSGEVADLYNAGKGYPNETTGARIARYLSYNWIGATSIDAGLSVEGVSTLADNTSVLDACLGRVDDENGNMWLDGNNTVQFRSRSARYLALTSARTFGENAAGGQAPYEADIAYDFDPTLIFNDVEITRAGGITAIGGRQAAIKASIKSFGKRSFTLTIGVASDAEAQDHADWIFAGHSQPVQRIASLTINPAANPALWPVALGTQIGDRVTVVRTTTAGYTMTADYFVERREQRRAAGSWKFTYQMSPVGPFQPGILDNGTYGRIGTDGSTLVSSITNSATSAVVATGVATAPASTWTIAGGDVTFTATIDTEKVTVTAIANLLTDTFTRTVSNGWGTSDTGQATTASGGSAANFATNGTVGTITNASVNAARYVTYPLSVTDFEATAAVKVPAVATGAAMNAFVVGRFADTSNHYRWQLAFNPDSTIDLKIAKLVAGVSTVLATVTGFATYAANTQVNVRAKILGSTLLANAWLSTASEKPGWMLTVTDTALTAAGAVGVMCLLTTGNTNSSPVFSFDNITTPTPQTLTITRPTDGSAAAHSAGAPAAPANPLLLAF